jgi:hypothetical protein
VSQIVKLPNARETVRQELLGKQAIADVVKMWITGTISDAEMQVWCALQTATTLLTMKARSDGRGLVVAAPPLKRNG